MTPLKNEVSAELEIVEKMIERFTRCRIKPKKIEMLKNKRKALKARLGID